MERIIDNHYNGAKLNKTTSFVKRL